MLDSKFSHTLDIVVSLIDAPLPITISWCLMLNYLIGMISRMSILLDLFLNLS